jgi:hypothetical protein
MALAVAHDEALVPQPGQLPSELGPPPAVAQVGSQVLLPSLSW